MPNDQQRLLYIFPSRDTSSHPKIDRLTRKMTAAFHKGTPGFRHQSFYTCCCGAHSDNANHTLPNGMQTNSLCIHFLAYHRDEIPEDQLQLVDSLNYGEEVPKELELCSPYLVSSWGSNTE